MTSAWVGLVRVCYGLWRLRSLARRAVAAAAGSVMLACAGIAMAQDFSDPDYGSEVATCREALRADVDEARGACDALLQSDEVTREGKTRIQLDYASLAITRGEFAEAERYLDDALLDNDILRQKNIYRYHLLRMKSLIHLRQDQFEQALPYTREALSVALAMQRGHSIATSYNDLGAIYLETGRYTEALANLQKALQELEKTENYYSTGLTLANIANVYRDLDDPESSVEYLMRSIDAHGRNLARNPDDAYGIRALGQVREDLGITYTHMGLYPSARKALSKAFDTFSEADWHPDQIRVLAALADVEVASGNARAALRLLEQALEMEQALLPKRSVEIRRALVASYQLQEDLERARHYAREGLELARASGQSPDELYFLEQLMTIAIGRGDARDALAHQQAYFALYRQSLEERYQSRIAELQNAIEVRQQARSISALKDERESLQRSVKIQRWLIGGAGVIVLLLLAIIVLVLRQRAAQRAYLSREIALHRQEFDADDGAVDNDESDESEAGENEPDNGNTVGAADSFAAALVGLMCSCVEIWEQASGETRIELAEKSRAWQVTVDNGRLRTRTMDRYCDLKKLPKVPRWRQVVRTCRYILINCDLSAAQRQRLNDELERVFAIQRSQALRDEA